MVSCYHVYVVTGLWELLILTLDNLWLRCHLPITSSWVKVFSALPGDLFKEEEADKRANRRTLSSVMSADSSKCDVLLCEALTAIAHEQQGTTVLWSLVQCPHLHLHGSA